MTKILRSNHTQRGALIGFAAVWQEGTEAADYVSVVLVGEDGGLVLAGYSTGAWGQQNLGEEDFVVIKLDEDGSELWRWQVKRPVFGRIV